MSSDSFFRSPAKIGVAIVALAFVAFGVFVIWKRSPVMVLQPTDRVTLYSIDGRDIEDESALKSDEKLRGYPVLGKLEITDVAERTAMADALNQGVRDGHSVANCFWPRHVIQVKSGEKVVDYVICFECHQVWIYTNDDKTKSVTRLAVTRTPQASLNKLLRAANIPLAPGMGPD